MLIVDVNNLPDKIKKKITKQKIKLNKRTIQNKAKKSLDHISKSSFFWFETYVS